MPNFKCSANQELSKQRRKAKKKKKKKKERRLWTYSDASVFSAVSQQLMGSRGFYRHGQEFFFNVFLHACLLQFTSLMSYRLAFTSLSLSPPPPLFLPAFVCFNSVSLSLSLPLSLSLSVSVSLSEYRNKESSQTTLEAKTEEARSKDFYSLSLAVSLSLCLSLNIEIKKAVKQR